MNKHLQIFILILLLAVVGCGKKEEDTPLALGPQIPYGADFKGVDFIDTENGISFRYYPHYKQIHRDENGAVLKEEKGKGRIALVVWPLDIDTYMWYVDAFADPITLERRLQKELLIKDKIISYRILEKEGAEAFLFTTKAPDGLYIQRIELFPKERPLQISLFFWHEKENDPEVLKMIGSIKILKTEEQEDEGTKD